MSMFLLCVMVLLSAGFEGSAYRKPKCSDLVEIMACPLNMAPVCGTDGNTYANDCALCVQRLKTKTDILITKDDVC
ncbi:serine peptidase inhibitor, Kazal type 4 [Brachyhypopomus gauderio]|uniref:serine peptidase inhibitor, Kazal type 4 n=1 Tax=Brachyhypopomus gauderio TaxID=698409 RepID=UPI004043349D